MRSKIACKRSAISSQQKQEERYPGDSYRVCVSGQLFQQRLRLLQVFGVKPFGEPVVDLR